MSSAAPVKPGSQYEIGKPLGKCAISGADILPGEKFMAALRETTAGFERVDISQSAWATFDHADLVGFWQTTMLEPSKAPRKLFVDDTVLCDLFERLAEATEPSKLNFRFVLGLILMRKKLLQHVDTRTDNGQEIWTMKVRGQDRTLDLLDPKMPDDQLGDVSAQLSQILNEAV